MFKNRVFVLLFIVMLLGAGMMAGCDSAVTDSSSTAPERASSASKLLENPTVSYLGPQGTYTEEAAKLFFSDGKLKPKGTVPEAIADIAQGNADYAVIPQENTLGGAVINYIDALIAEDNIYVVGEVILPINQTLMALPGAKIEDIKTVYSHAQGLVQTEKWRKENLPEAEAKEMDSTAAAASYVAGSGDKTIAAIAAPGAARLYGLNVLADNVQITDVNKTRFYVLSGSELKDTEKT